MYGTRRKMSLISFAAFAILLTAHLVNGFVDINAIVNAVRAQTIFVFAEDAVGDSSDNNLKASGIPKAFINTHADYQLKHNFGRNILSMVLLNQEWPAELLETFKKTLHRRHLSDVLFLSDTDMTEVNVKWLRKLFQWCWDNGFVNALFMHGTSDNLYTFNPFPTVEPMLTSLDNYVRLRNNLRDFKGYTIRSTAGNNPPRALVYYDDNGDVVFDGACPEMVKLFVKRYNATLQLKIMPNMANYAINDCFLSLHSRDADICADGMDKRIIETLSVHMLYASYVLVPNESLLPKFRYFLYPFEYGVWIIIGCSVAYITVILGLMNRIQSGVWNIGDHLMTSIVATIYGGRQVNHVQGPLKYIVEILLIIVGFIISNFYLALLSSILTTNIYSDNINTLEDLKKYGIAFMFTDIDKDISRSVGIEEEIMNDWIELPITEFNKHRASLDTSYAYANMIDKLHYYMYQQKFMKMPRMKVLEKPLGHIVGGIPYVQYWPFEELMDIHLMHMIETGLYDEALETTTEEAIRLGYLKFFHTKSLDAEPLDLEYFEMPAILLAIGSCMSVLIFISEWFCYWWSL